MTAKSKTSKTKSLGPVYEHIPTQTTWRLVKREGDTFVLVQLFGASRFHGAANKRPNKITFARDFRLISQPR